MRQNDVQVSHKVATLPCIRLDETERQLAWTGALGDETKYGGYSCCSIHIHLSYQTSPQRLKEFLSKWHKSGELLLTDIVLLQNILWKETRPRDRSRKTKTHPGCPFRHQLSGEKGIVNVMSKVMTIYLPGSGSAVMGYATQ